MYSQGLNASFDLWNNCMPQSYGSLTLGQLAVNENELISLGQISDFLDGDLNFRIKDITPEGDFAGFFSTDNFMFQKFIQVRTVVDNSTNFTAVTPGNNLRLTLLNTVVTDLIYGNIAITNIRENDLFLFRGDSFNNLNQGQGIYKIETITESGADIIIDFSPYFLQKRSDNYISGDPLKLVSPLDNKSQIIITSYEGLNGGKMYYYVDDENDGGSTDVPFPEIVAEKRLQGVVPINYLYGNQFPLFSNKMSDLPEGYDFYYLEPQEPDPLIVNNNNNVFNFLHVSQQPGDYVYTYNQLKSFINSSTSETAILDFRNSNLKPYLVQYTQTTIVMNGISTNQQCANFLEIDTIELDPSTRITFRRLEDSCVLFIEGYTGDVQSGNVVVRFNFTP